MTIPDLDIVVVYRNRTYGVLPLLNLVDNLGAERLELSEVDIGVLLVENYAALHITLHIVE